jgi:hypothetical protein
MGFKFRAVACGGVAAAAALAFTVPGLASASTPPDSLSCTFTGSTTSLTQIPAGSAFAPSTPHQAEEGDANYTTGDTGAYTFGGTATCAGTYNGSPIESSGTIASSGNYYNVTCGTGEAFSGAQGESSATPATVTLTNPTVTFDVYYTIQFSGGQGSLVADVVAPDGSTSDASGVVDIRPSNTGGCVTGPVTGFTVTGSVSGGGGTDASEG